MIRIFSLGLSSMLVVVALTAGAQASPRVSPTAKREKSRTSRTIEVRYERGAMPYLFCLDCPDVTPQPGERFMSVEVIDDISPLASLDVSWTTTNPDDPGYFNVCGKTKRPHRIPPSADLTLYPWMIPGEPFWPLALGTGCTEGFSTSGTVKITFMNRPPG